ncbi:MAG: Glu/Leu/Phe/Val dehydrogenase [Candidatus Burarchaeum sp.]|nr:Glu/Leu/Phe/Val dehydrogenase [Candidatus Burarchaeum sp.]MDO8340214.1 Glu/Leu/Phe/Val dehydrogenase [Candidatus Burarchaeum sp.]
MVSFDDYGPEEVVMVQDPKTGIHGYLVIDNTALGPGKGGVRLMPDITVDEVARLARAMTWKNAMAGLPLGGAKAGIRADPYKVDRQEALRALARGIKDVIPHKYVAGPDMNTGEAEMAAFANEVGTPKSATGKPRDMGGLPHELGSTGFGVAHSVAVALEFAGVPINGARIVIEGFGNVGSFTAKHLSSWGAKIIAVSERAGTLYDPGGLEVSHLIKEKAKRKTLVRLVGGKCEHFAKEKLFGLECDVLVPGARPDAIDEHNWQDIKAKIIVPGANIPIRPEIEKKLADEKKVLIVPDFVANAGGIISSYTEMIGGTPEEMFERVENTIRKNTKLVLEKARDEKKYPRDAAMEISRKIIDDAMEKKGWRPKASG